MADSITYTRGGVGYDIYTMRQTHIPQGRGRYEFVSLYTPYSTEARILNLALLSA